jgi:hypothetical protein
LCHGGFRGAVLAAVERTGSGIVLESARRSRLPRPFGGKRWGCKGSVQAHIYVIQDLTR